MTNATPKYSSQLVPTQDESRNISENSRWGIVKGFKGGKVFCNTTRFLAYDKDENGELVINEK